MQDSSLFVTASRQTRACSGDTPRERQVAGGRSPGGAPDFPTVVFQRRNSAESTTDLVVVISQKVVVSGTFFGVAEK